MVQRCDEGTLVDKALHVPLGRHELRLEALHRNRLSVQQALLHRGAGPLAQLADLPRPTLLSRISVEL